MANVSRTEPDALSGQDWLAAGEYLTATDVVDDAGDLVLDQSGGDYLSEGWRASAGLNVDAIKSVASSQVSWQSTTPTGTEVGVQTALTGSDWLGSLRGDGVDDYGDTASKVSTPSDYTVMVWVKFLSKVTDDFGQWIVTNRNPISSDSSWQIIWSYGATALRISHYSTDANSYGVNALSTDPTLGQWYHVAFTYNESAQELKTYLDGNLANTLSSVPASANNSDYLRLLARWGDEIAGANADLSQLKIWTRTLSETEISEQVYNPPDTSDTDLLNWWPLDEGSGSTAADNAGNNDITITGATWQPGESGLWQDATNGESIPGISQSDDLSGKYLHCRQDLSTTDVTQTPRLESLTVTLNEQLYRHWWARRNRVIGALQ